MPTRYYVTAHCHARGKKRLIGPFEEHRQASAMTWAMHLTVKNDPEYRNDGINVESVTIGQKRLNNGARFPKAHFNLARIDLADVIEAAARHKAIYYDRR